MPDTLLTSTSDDPAPAVEQASSAAGRAPVADPTSGDWRASLSEDIRAHPSLKDVDSPETLAKNYVNLEKLLGTEKVPLPKGEDDEEGWNRVYKAVGRPDTPDAYEIEAPQLPESVPYDPEGEKYYRTLVHQHGLNQRQAKGLWDALVKFETEKAAAGMPDPVQAREEAVTALKREWGTKYPQRIAEMRRGVAEYADEDFKAWLDQTGMGNDVRMVKTFARIGAELGGETKLKDTGGRASGGDVHAEIRKFRKAKEKVLMDRYHPDHADATAQLSRLYESAYPEK